MCIILFIPLTSYATGKAVGVLKEKVQDTNLSNDDINELYIISDLLITDYSSIYMDFAYMSKPIIYYPFDFDEFHKRQLKETKNKIQWQ